MSGLGRSSTRADRPPLRLILPEILRAGLKSDTAAADMKTSARPNLSLTRLNMSLAERTRTERNRRGTATPGPETISTPAPRADRARARARPILPEEALER